MDDPAALVPPLPEDDRQIIHMEIDVRSHFSPFNFPNLMEVIRAIEVSFAADLTKVVKAQRGPLLGLYTIDADDYEIYAGKTVQIRGETLPLLPRFYAPRRSQSERPGTLITLYDAYTKRNQQIPAMSFDAYFMEMEGVEILKQTTPQRHKNTRVLNGNRFIVLQYDANVIDLGDSIQVEGYKFNIRYRGMQKYCYLCKARHGEECPARARFEELKQLRKDKLTHKIYADSSLRHANQLALTANVACMSGGGIGQVVNAIKLDGENVNKIVIFAGANEISRTDDLKEFVYTIDKASEKLHDLAKDKEISFLLPTIPLATIEEKGKFEYLKTKMLATKSIKVLSADVYVPYEDHHPTEDGTKVIIGQIQEDLQQQIILADEETTTDRRYSQVQAVYKVGCRGCTVRKFTPTLCDQCKQEAAQVDCTALEKMMQDIIGVEYPNGLLDGDVDMGEILKRQLPPDGELTGNNKKKGKVEGGEAVNNV